MALLLIAAALAVLLSCSRGGAIALAAAGAVTLIGFYCAGLLQGRRLFVLGGAAVAVFFAISLVGYEAVSERLDSLASGELDQVDQSGGRRRIWQANVQAIRAGGWFGAGAGSHREIYPLYIADEPNKQYTHAENGYLQIVTENGLPGALLLATALGLGLAWSFRAVRTAGSSQAAAYAIACAAGLVASAIHSACDFVWYIPACLSATLVLAACVMRLGELKSASGQVSPRLGMGRGARQDGGAIWESTTMGRSAAGRLAVAVSLLGAFTIAEFVGPAAAAMPWDAYLRTSHAQRAFSQQLVALSLDNAQQTRAKARDSQLAAVESMIRDLRDVIDRRPAFASAHRQLANRYLELFHLRQEAADNPMPASQLRDAAIQSQFRSAALLHQWLARAVGPHSELLYRAQAHARTAAGLSPLPGEPYVRLADLCFLQGKGFAETDACLAQAIRVRPHDGELLFEVGAQLWARGLNEPGLQCWQSAFRIRGNHRVHLARCVAGNIPAATLIELFAPEWDTLPECWKAYRAAGPAEWQALLAYAAEQARRECTDATATKAAHLWRTLATMQSEAGESEAALASLHRSWQASRDDFATRRMLGMVLAAAGKPHEAGPHLQWCLDRRPEDAHVKTVLRRLTHDRLAARTRKLE